MFDFDNPLTIEAIDLERHMNDNASRVEMVSLAQKRFFYMQKLMLKTQALSDKDFETAVSTFDSVVDNLNKKSQAKEEPSKTAKNKITSFIT